MPSSRLGACALYTCSGDVCSEPCKSSALQAYDLDKTREKYGLERRAQLSDSFERSLCLNFAKLDATGWVSACVSP